jgi:diguanylate cyclase (GGDEF)-like protein
MNLQKNRRILVIDDNRAIHEDFRKILARPEESTGLAEAEAMVLGVAPSTTPAAREVFDVESAYQGEEGWEKVRASVAADRKYAVAFVDMRMPPGWDGVETVIKIWEVDPEMQIVICTAYSDYSWEEINQKLGHVDRFWILKKPFDTIEVCQLARALTQKWQLARQANLTLNQLRMMVEEQTRSLQAEVIERRKSEAQLRHDALHDTLTGLANRALLMDRMNQCLQRLKRAPEQSFAVIFLDLDRFEVINDSLGHAAGDQLLIELAKRLEITLRTGDTVSRREPDHLARLGGDEFVALLEGIHTPADAVRVANRLQQATGQPFNIDGHEVFASVSFGIALSNGVYSTPEEILRDADTALYDAKSAGRGGYRLFDQQMHASAMQRLLMESELRRAIERGELRLLYQPVQSLQTGQLAEVEALVRWEHPQRGSISPAEFIPLAEETGLILQLGQWVLCEACRQVRLWQTEVPQLRDLAVAVNVSGKQFARAQLPAEIASALAETGFHPRHLKLEITETAIMGTGEPALAELNAIRGMGVGFHLDDFGTGYSSLSYLRRMPIEALKIDRSFIAALGSDRTGDSIVQAIVALARALDMRVVAEGVEHKSQADFLRDLGCDFGQGYYFARPLTAEQLVRFAARVPGPDNTTIAAA